MGDHRLIIDMEPELLPIARAYVATQLAAEFPKAAKSRGGALAAGSFVTGRVDGDEVHAEVQEKGETHKVKLTLPLFGGVSVAQCDCTRQIAAGGELRCAHLWATLKMLERALAVAEDR